MILTFFYSKMIERIIAKVPEVKLIDLWNNQPAMIGEEDAIDVPAVYIEMLPVDWQTRGQKEQQGDLVFILRLVTEATGTETNSREPQERIEAALERLTIAEKLFKALHGYQAYDGASQFGKIIRVTNSIDSNSSQLNTDALTFKTRLTDSAAVPVVTTTPLTLKLNGEIKLD